MGYRPTNYRRIYEKFNNCCILPGMHIHHIDGNKFNNDISNLLCCTSEEHYLIHLKQGDTVALNGKFIQFSANKIKCKHSEETKVKMKAAQSGESHAMYGKKHTDETKTKMRILAKLRMQDPEFKKKCLGHKPVNQRKVLNIDTGVFYESLKDASICLGIAVSTVFKYCNWKIKKRLKFNLSYADNLIL